MAKDLEEGGDGRAAGRKSFEEIFGERSEGQKVQVDAHSFALGWIELEELYATGERK